MEIHNPHDKFFKELLSDKARAVNLLQALLSKELAALLDLDTIEKQDGSYITKELKAYFTDVLFKVKLKQGEQCYISLLLEHKSYKDVLVPIQLLTYLGNAYQSQLKNKEPLTLILPVVYYHGKESWNLKSIEHLFSNYSDDLLRYVPKFKTELIDLQALSEKELINLAGNMLSSPLLLQKYATDSEALSTKIVRILSTLDPYLKKNFLNTIFVYSSSLVELTNKEVEEVIDNLPNPIKGDFMTTYEMIVEKGKKEGRIEATKKFQEQTIINCHKAGFTKELAAQILELSLEEVTSIYAELTLKE